MCRAVPARVLRVEGETAWVEHDGAPLRVSLVAVPEVAVGDYVYHHAGLAIELLEPEEAEVILATLAELDASIESL
jgi:hydrogenase expression/formation protein HypC